LSNKVITLFFKIKYLVYDDSEWGEATIPTVYPYDDDEKAK